MRKRWDSARNTTDRRARERVGHSSVAAAANDIAVGAGGGGRVGRVAGQSPPRRNSCSNKRRRGAVGSYTKQQGQGKAT